MGNKESILQMNISDVQFNAGFALATFIMIVTAILGSDNIRNVFWVLASISFIAQIIIIHRAYTLEERKLEWIKNNRVDYLSEADFRLAVNFAMDNNVELTIWKLTLDSPLLPNGADEEEREWLRIDLGNFLNMPEDTLLGVKTLSDLCERMSENKPEDTSAGSAQDVRKME